MGMLSLLKLQKVNIMVATVIWCGMSSIPAFAESAPVYDADSLPQQFYNADTDQDSSASDPAEQESAAFVPAPREAAGASQNNIGSLEPPSPVPPPSLTSEQRLKRVEQQISNLQTNDGPVRIEALQKQVQTLRGQVEQLTHQVQQLQDQQKNTYSDSKALPVQNEESVALTETHSTKKSVVQTKKLANESTEANNSPTSGEIALSNNTAKAASDKQPNVAEEQQIYQTAYNLIKAKKYNDAVNALQKMLKKYPTGQFAANAHYWLGELYGLLDKRSQALTEFNIVASAYPNSPRVSDAQLKIGLIYASDSKWSEAKGAFKKVINRYPGTSSSRLAAEQLKQIKQAGH